MADESSSWPYLIEGFMVYVDNYWGRFGGMIMSHMTADTVEELHQMADKLGLKRSWFQDRLGFPHYDVSASMWRKALALGAQAETCREMILRRRGDNV